MRSQEKPKCACPTDVVRNRASLLIGSVVIAAFACAAPREPQPRHLTQPKVAEPPPVVEPQPTADSGPAPFVPPPLPEPPGEISLAAVGDIMLGSTYPAGSPLPPKGGTTLLSQVTPLLQEADIAFGNLEAPLVDGNPKPTCTPGAIAEKNHGSHSGGTNCWSFRMPASYGAVLSAAGFDVLSIANNHILDFGEEGRTSTIEVLDRLGMAYSGPVGTVAHLTVRTTKVDIIAFGTYDTSNDMTHLDTASALVARSAATADVVVVSFHGGAEGPTAQHVPATAETFWGEDRGAVRTFARSMVDAGADLVVGHGPHVVRGMEIRKGRLIAYSLGNFATYGAMNLSGVRGISLILDVQLGGDGAFLKGQIHPIRQKAPGGPEPEPSGAVIRAITDLSKADFAETSPQVSATGGISAP